MSVQIVMYRGTVYGVYSTYEKAAAFVEEKFGRSALMCLDVCIYEKEVK